MVRQQSTQVWLIGAGRSRLLLARQLKRQGIDSVIIQLKAMVDVGR